jgi:hypothetical protein
MRRSLCAALLGCVLLSAGSASAASFGVGTRWHLFGVPLVYPVAFPGGVIGNSDFPTADLLLSINPKMHIIAGLDFVQGGCAKCVTNDAGDQDAASFQAIGISAGLRYLFSDPADGKASPFIHGGLFKYLASVNDKSAGMTNDGAQFAADLLSPLGVEIALGGEYRAGGGFAIGLEAVGIRYATSSASAGNADETLTSITLYSALTLTFYDLFGGEPAAPAAGEGGFGGQGGFGTPPPNGGGFGGQGGFGTPPPGGGTPGWGTPPAGGGTTPPPAGGTAPPPGGGGWPPQQ